MDAWSNEKEYFIYRNTRDFCTPQECGNYMQVLTLRNYYFSHIVCVDCLPRVGKPIPKP